MCESVRRNLWRTWLVIATAVAGVWLMPVQAHAEPPVRLVYEIVVFAPGSRSQGWEATLYDPDGHRIETPVGQTVTTPLGEFVHVPDIAFQPSGMIRTDMAEWMKTHNANVIMDNAVMDMGPWAYRVYVNGEGSGNEVWTSTLLHNNTEIPPDTNPIDTPMGPFRTGGPDATGWARAGWLPVSWLEPTPDSIGAPLELAGTAWRFVEILGAPTPSTVQTTLELLANGTAAGQAACNGFNGQYAVANGGLTFTDLSYTKRMCAPELMSIESAVQTVLNRTSGGTTVAGELHLVAADGTLLARLVPE